MDVIGFYRRHLRDTPVGSVARLVARPVVDGAAKLRPMRAQIPIIAGKAAAAARELPGKAVNGAGAYRQTAWNILYRGRYVLRYYAARIRPAFPWLTRSRETSNFTYDLTPRNKKHLASLIAYCLDRPSTEILAYIDELSSDEALQATIIGRVNELGRSVGLDPTAQFGRRLGWYALARAMKPRLIIETGVEKGLGATVLCAALLRNQEEGHPGRYFGTDIDPGAGLLFTGPYRDVGEILYGDSIESLEKLNETIDLFINDSDHSAEYEGREYRTIRSKLSERAIIIGDNAHVTDELYQFSVESNRHFLFFREEPADHWYLGAGIGLSLPQDARR